MKQFRAIEISGWLHRTLRAFSAAGIILAILRVDYLLPSLRNTTVTYSLLLAILVFAIYWDRLETLIASAIAALGFLVYFQPPIGSFKARDPESYVAVAAFLITALVVSNTELKARRRAADAHRRRRETEQLYELGQAMLAADSVQANIYIATHQAVPIFAVSSVAFYVPGDEDIYRGGTVSDAITPELLHRTAAVRTPHVDHKSKIYLVPVDLGTDIFGAFGLCGTRLSETVLRSISSLLATVFARIQVSEKLLTQQRMSESLLLNILPGEVAEELRTRGMVSPRYFEDVTILFTDFVGFTLSAEKLAAEELVETLHDYFTAFDRIVMRYGLEKMKTIGDSYMCLSGLPHRNPAHPVDTVMAAFEMLRFVEQRSEENPDIQWKVRIGIHTGPVVAGVVGINKFAFDIWGDTVNYSSRMESSGAANRINLSEQTYGRVKDFFVCEHRGKVLTKDKRALDMYFACALQPALMPALVPAFMPAPVQELSQSPPIPFVRRYNVYFQKDPPSFPSFLLAPMQVPMAEL